MRRHPPTLGALGLLGLALPVLTAAWLLPWPERSAAPEAAGPDIAPREAPPESAAYPLDGYEFTQIRRLLAYRQILSGEIPGSLALPPGARRSSDEIRLRMTGASRAYDVGATTERDSRLQAGIERILSNRHPSYRIALLDVTEPETPRYAGVRDDQGYIPGSVGKILVMAGLFEQLRRLYPDDVEARADLLRNTRIEADAFAFPNSHSVPVVAPDGKSVSHRAIRSGDVFSLWEWVDHMVSPSSNAAGAVVWKQVLLLEEFGADYPPAPEREAAFLRETPKNELTERSVRLLEAPLEASGIDTRDLRLGTYFTAGAKRAIPGRSSHATPRQLVRFLLRMEQGALVDRWSSLEMKKLLYFTRRRYRYAASPALSQSAVFFKSGSLYRCRPEPDYECGQYRGNAENLMHSVAIVETPRDSDAPLVYLISMMSNVPKVNSASEHLEIATQVERLVRERNQ